MPRTVDRKQDDSVFGQVTQGFGPPLHVSKLVFTFLVTYFIPEMRRERVDVIFGGLEEQYVNMM